MSPYKGKSKAIFFVQLQQFKELYPSVTTDRHAITRP